ncbi:MAG: DUF167 family protein [Kiritimatiellia bacterium]|jgi:hypothetical protein|nr:DUF167 family protein [Kiritimatiellia bacterium]
MSWLIEDSGSITINVRVVPRASKNEFTGLHGDSLRIRLQAPPVDGKANAALVKFLASRLGIPKRNVVIVSGETGRQKRIRVSGSSRQDVVALSGE